MDPKQEPKAERFVGYIGAVAETVSVFYNSLVRQVPKDVALSLTKHMMDVTMGRGAMGAAETKLLEDIQRRAMEQRKKQQEQPEDSAIRPERAADAESDPETNIPAEQPPETKDMPED